MVEGEAGVRKKEEEEKLADALSLRAIREYFPLAAVVGQESIKTALLLSAVDPYLGGVIIFGDRGTAKTVMARGLASMLPPIEVVDGSYCNADPEKPSEWEPELVAAVRASSPEGTSTSVTPESMRTKVVPTPFVQVPLAVTEDRLVGSVDMEKSLKEGKTCFEPGLLAQSHRGVMYIDDINLVEDGIVNLLLSIIAQGENVVEREGVSVRHPSRPLLIATFNPEEGDVKEHLLDRIGISLSAESIMDMERRRDVIDRAIAFQENPEEVLESVKELTEQAKTQVILAREYLKEVRITDDQVGYLVDEAMRGGVMGHRAEIFATRAAKALAALDSRDYVTTDDLKTAVNLVILPRAIMNNEMDEDQEPPPPPPPPPPPEEEEPGAEQDNSADDAEDQEEDEDEDDEDDDSDSDEDDTDDDDDEEEAPQVPEDFVFDPEGVIMDPAVFQLAQKLNKRNAAGRTGRSKNVIFSNDRGRFLKAVLPKGDPKKGLEGQKIALDATLRAAAPYQASRRESYLEEHPDDEDIRNGKVAKVFIKASDIRVKRLKRRAGSLVIFLVDASGSMALNRMQSAKGAAIRLLTDSYQKRDQISLIPFRGDEAEILLPPSRSITLAQRRLETLPCGGGSPLAHALYQGVQIGESAKKRKDVGRVMLVVLTDGRANVPLSRAVVLPDRPDKKDSRKEEEGKADEGAKPTDERAVKQEKLREEVLDMARSAQAAGIDMLVIDTESKFVSTGFAKEIAKAAKGQYYYLPGGDENAISNATQEALQTFKAQ